MPLSDVQLCRVTPVDLPRSVLSPGDYILRDKDGVLLSVVLRRAITVAALARAISECHGPVLQVA